MKCSDVPVMAGVQPLVYRGKGVEVYRNVWVLLAGRFEFGGLAVRENSKLHGGCAFDGVGKGAQGAFVLTGGEVLGNFDGDLGANVGGRDGEGRRWGRRRGRRSFGMQLGGGENGIELLTSGNA